MTALTDFLDSRIFNTALTLIVGGLLFSWISFRRSRRDKIREKVIEFLEEVANDFNLAISRNFGDVRRPLEELKPSEMPDNFGHLFRKRFSVNLKSESYLKSKDFSEKYDYLIWEIRELSTFIWTHQEHVSQEEGVLGIQERKKALADYWPIPDEPMHPEEDLTPLFQELLEWNHMIYVRALSMLRVNLTKIK